MDVKTLRFGVALAAMLVLVAPSVARADDPPKPKVSDPDPNLPASMPRRSASDAALAHIIDRPHTIAELEAGVIALPTAPITKGQVAGDGPCGLSVCRGDLTSQVGLHVLYRWNRSFAVGAGVIFSPLPSTDNEYGGQRSLARTHGRSYLFMGGEGRYIPFHYKFLEAWVGVSAGAVVVADRFTTKAGDAVPAIVGTKEVTIRTEGFAFGAQLGGSYYLSENWVAGLNFRAYGWLLPEARRCSSIGDCATLSGTVNALELGLTIGYRLPL